MSEADWLEGRIRKMLDYARVKGSMRKRRLLACGYCRLRWSELPDERLKQFVEQIERYADGESGGSLVRAYEVFGAVKEPAVLDALPPDLLPVLRSAQASNEDPPGWSFPVWKDASLQVTLLRDLFGNPYQPTSLDPTWLSPTVINVARSIYADHAFGDLPILADALLDAGCDNETLLDHCRSAGSHIRGCWIVDLVLEKT